MPDWRLRCLRRHRRIKKRIQSYYSQANDFTGISSSDTFSCYRLAFFIFPDQTSIAENVLLHISSERNQPLFFFSLYFWYMIDACFHRLNSYFLSMRCPFMLQWSDLHWEECMTIICILSIIFFSWITTVQHPPSQIFPKWPLQHVPCVVTHFPQEQLSYEGHSVGLRRIRETRFTERQEKPVSSV